MKQQKLNVTVFDHYSSQVLESHPDKLFIFGDNAQRTGLGGQAQIRNEPNAIGIATKESPGLYMNDDNLTWNTTLIELDIQTALRIYKEGGFAFIVLPKGGLGTGLAELPTRAPQTNLYLKNRLKEVFGFDNDNGTLYELEEQTADQIADSIPEGQGN